MKLKLKVLPCREVEHFITTEIIDYANYTDVAGMESARSTSSTMCSLAYRQSQRLKRKPGNHGNGRVGRSSGADMITIPPYDENSSFSFFQQNITTSSENTTSQLTAPSGKSTSDFDYPAASKTDENPADAVDIFTETIIPKWNGALPRHPPPRRSDIYQFASPNGTAHPTYCSVTPQWTIGTPITISGWK
ncbi:MAG: hypothetical protein IPJ67_00010 [Candidatus Moraniibacteriota bacterium]|nr:MAG: hypothetical protein IPJ67_00010 [Candidatus Moranbacteria bacterium]